MAGACAAQPTHLQQPAVKANDLPSSCTVHADLIQESQQQRIPARKTRFLSSVGVESSKDQCGAMSFDATAGLQT